MEVEIFTTDGGPFEGTVTADDFHALKAELDDPAVVMLWVQRPYAPEILINKTQITTISKPFKA